MTIWLAIAWLVPIVLLLRLLWWWGDGRAEQRCQVCRSPTSRETTVGPGPGWETWQVCTRVHRVLVDQGDAA